jgi:hypothetical protein
MHFKKLGFRLGLALLEKGRCLSEGAAGEIKAPKSTKNEE